MQNVEVLEMQLAECFQRLAHVDAMVCVLIGKREGGGIDARVRSFGTPEHIDFVNGVGDIVYHALHEEFGDPDEPEKPPEELES